MTLGLFAIITVLVCLGGACLLICRERMQVALILRLENPDVLKNSLGRTGFDQLTKEMVHRVLTCLAPKAPVQIGNAGDFTAHMGLLTAREITRCATILRKWCETRGMPAVSAVLVRTGRKRVQEDEIVSFGRKVLARQGPGRAGHITVITYDLFNPDRVAMLASIYSADWLRLRFQPQLCSDTGAIIGAEAQVFLDHPQQGILEAASFLPALTRDEVMDLACATISQVAQAFVALDQRGLGLATMSLSLPQQFLDLPDLADTILWELDRQDIAPLRLSLLLGEGVDMGDNLSPPWTNIQRLSGAGCLIELDDFGIVGATFDGIKRAGATQIRIGRNFVAGCHHAIEQQRMILAILALADHLGIATAAQNVETTSELGFLTQMGVMRIQGNAVAAPMSLEELFDFRTLHRTPETLALPMRHAG